MISSIGEPAIPVLIEAIRAKRLDRTDILIGIVGDIGGIAARQALAERLRDPDPAIRRSAAFALCSTKDPSAIPALRAAAHDPETEVRRAIAAAFGKCGGADTIEDLLSLLHDSAGNVRNQAVCCIDDICALKPSPPALGPAVPRLIGELIVALDDRDSQVAAFAGRSLEHFADPRAIPGLISALSREGAPVRVVVDALRAFGELAMPGLRQAANEPNVLLRLRAIDLVARYGGDEDAAFIAGILRDPTPDTRLRAIEHIGYGLQQSPLVLEALIERLRDTEEDIALAAIEALGEIAKPSAAPHLIECLKVEALAPSAARVLGNFDTREVRAALRAWNKSIKVKSAGGPDGLEG
jgi:HEAT repeat protein